MTTVRVSVQTTSRLGSMGRRVPRAMDGLAKETAQFVVDAARASMVKSGGGRVYVRYGVPHSASVPGAAPAIWSGALFESMHVERKGLGGYQAVAGAYYAGYLEYGTRFMAPRPFMRPAARKGRAYMGVKGRIRLYTALAGAT